MGPNIHHALSAAAAVAPTSREKSFPCTFCQRLFARLEHLTRHERIHTKEKPYRCLKCPRAFSRSDLLVRHRGFSHAENVRRAGPATAADSLQAKNSLWTISGAQIEREEQSSPQGWQFSSGLSVGESWSEIPQSSFQNALPPDLMNNFDYSCNAAVPDKTSNLPTSHNYDPLIEFSAEVVGTEDSRYMNHSLLIFGNPNIPHLCYPSIASAEQSLPAFPYEINFDFGAPPHTNGSQDHATECPNQLDSLSENFHSLPRLGSLLTSLVSDSPPSIKNQSLRDPSGLWDVTVEDRNLLLGKIRAFHSVIPAGFVLPSQYALSRYLDGYANGFHKHLPFLHLSSFTIEGTSVELVLAIAAIGSRYCFESVKAGELFKVSKAIALERIRDRQNRPNTSSDDSRIRQEFPTSSSSNTAAQPATPNNPNDIIGIRYYRTMASCSSEDLNLLQISQTLLLLMAMATWSGNRTMYGEALALQGNLATMIREHGLLKPIRVASASWEDWIQFEGAKRTYFIIYCFFTFHCIVYDTAPAILNTELVMDLPCSEIEWKCPTAAAWKEIHHVSGREPKFQDCLQSLFTNQDDGHSWCYSSLGNYILILGLIQEIFLVRQVTKCRPCSDGSIPPSEVSALERALQNWQHGWEKNPESSLDPKSVHGPLPFNSIALLRIAYIRILFDVGPWRALETQDPERIASAMLGSPIITRSHQSTRAALHSAHALSIPIRVGLNLIARNQIPTWSLQHSICSLECALLLSKWLDIVTTPSPALPLTTDEQSVLDLVVDMLIESDSERPSIGIDKDGITCTQLSARVMRVWARAFSSERIWKVVDVVGRAMNAYAEILEGVDTRPHPMMQA